jgi:hypothetical protein
MRNITTKRSQRSDSPEASKRIARLSNLLARNEGPDGDPDLSADQWREYDRLQEALFRNRDLERSRD